MSAVKKRPVEEASPSSSPGVEGYDLWRARRDLERYIFDRRDESGSIAPELLRVRDFLLRLSGAD